MARRRRSESWYEFGAGINAKVYASRAEANQDAKRIMSSVPDNIANLRVVGV